MKMKKKQALFLGMAVLGALAVFVVVRSVQNARIRQQFKLVLFKADWCAPCKELQRQMTQQSIVTHWPVHVGPFCDVRIPIVYVDSEKDAHTDWMRMKQTDSYPEQNLFFQNRLLATDRYSDTRSMDFWLQAQLQQQRKGLRFCGVW